MGRAVIFAILCGLALGSTAHAKDVRISEKTRYYTVFGDTIQDLVKSMIRRGPYSEDHRRRAVGLADYKYRTIVKTQREDGLCSVKKASVIMNIVYIVPKLSGARRLSSRDQKRWRRISTMIERHEQQHGRYYSRMANEIQQGLIKLKPQRQCSQLRILAKKLQKKLEARDKRRNQRFDRGQYPPFQARINSLAPGWKKRRS